MHVVSQWTKMFRDKLSIQDATPSPFLSRLHTIQYNTFLMCLNVTKTV